MKTSLNRLIAKDYSTTLKQKPNNKAGFFVPIDFHGYSDLGYTIENISIVCSEYLHNVESKTIKGDLNVVIKLLEIQRQLIPHPELDLLDNLEDDNF